MFPVGPHSLDSARNPHRGARWVAAPPALSVPTALHLPRGPLSKKEKKSWVWHNQGRGRPVKTKRHFSASPTGHSQIPTGKGGDGQAGREWNHLLPAPQLSQAGSSCSHCLPLCPKGGSSPTPSGWETGICHLVKSLGGFSSSTPNISPKSHASYYY